MTRNHIAFAFLVALSLAIGALLVRLPASDLAVPVFALTGTAWMCFAVLGSAAFGGQRIGALTERTFIALVIALLGTVACLLVANTELGRPWFDIATSSLLFRMAVLAVLSVPAIWLVMWRMDRLGGSEEERSHKRIGDTDDRTHRREDG